MELSPKTKVNDLLARYPFLKDFLISLNQEFKMLDNAFMRKTVGRIASLGKVAMIGGMDVEKLLDGIAAEITKKTGEAVTISYGEEGKDDQEVRIETLKNIIKELHEGKDAESQKKKFQELIKDVAPWEIAQMEQHGADGVKSHLMTSLSLPNDSSPNRSETIPWNSGIPPA